MALSGVVRAPGRVNLIGEHIDYHNLAVLPIALAQHVRVHWRARNDHKIRVMSLGFEPREFEWTADLRPVAAGDWENYVRAAAQAYTKQWGVGRGIDAEIESDLPAAAGLSSSSALIVGVTLALLAANERSATFEELMDVLPEGEHFVGTRGGGMDHAASLASRAGCASLIEFAPVSLTPIALPEDWAFLVAHSGKTAEKSGAAREEYNARRSAGSGAPARLGFASYREALARHPVEELAKMAQSDLSDPRERDSFLHVVSEASRVRQAVRAFSRDEANSFGALLLQSHASLRDRLRVSCRELDALVESAMASGALGARLTGAGFGGCAVIFCRQASVERVRAGVRERFYGGAEGGQMIEAVASDGALYQSRFGSEKLTIT